MDNPNIVLDIEKNNLVYAPNSFGKTRSSEYYNKKLLDDDKLVGFFTRKKVEELITISGNKLYLGSSSKYESELSDISNLLEKNTESGLKELASNYRCKNTKKDFELNSYFLRLNNIVNPKNASNWLLNIIKTNGTKDEFLECDEIFQFDKELSKFDIEKLIDSKDINKAKVVLKNPISGKNYESIQNLYNMVVISEMIDCPLCGTDFKTNTLLKESIEKVLNKYTPTDRDTIDEQIRALYSEILDVHPKKQSPIWKLIENENNIVTILKYIDYLNHFDQYYLYCFRVLIDKKIGLDKLDNLVNRIEKLEILISKEKKSLYDSDNFVDDIIKEFNELLIMPIGTSIIKDKTDLSIKFVSDGNELSPYEVMSESEVKKLSLAVMYSKIVNSGINYIILDDPMDSYDDFSLIKSTHYIHEKLLSTQVIWTIMSHNIEFILTLSKYSDIQDVEFYYCFNETTSNPLSKAHFSPRKMSIKTPLKHIAVFKHHDVKIIYNIIKQRNSNSEFQIDTNFAFLSFLSVIRSFKMDLLSNLNIFDRNKSIRKRINKIEKNYLHYSLYEESTVKDLEWIYDNWFKAKKSTPLYNRNTSLTIERKKFLSLPYNEILRSSSDNIILLDVLFKLLWVSECKYLIDEALIKLVKKALDIETKELEKISGDAKIKPKKRTSSKIKYIKNKYYTSLSTQQTYLFDSLAYLFESNVSLINNYSHSSSKFYPPYISTSIFEIRTMYIKIIDIMHEIDSL